MNSLCYRLSKREDNERNNGYGFVEFSSGDECKNAIQHCKQDTFNETRLSGELLSSLMLPNEDNVLLDYSCFYIIEFKLFEEYAS